jgi:hypothetical protein
MESPFHRDEMGAPLKKKDQALKVYFYQQTDES